MKINYAAVVVSAVAYWLLGGLWYGLLFTAPYRELENLGVMPAGMNAALPYFVTFLLDLVIAAAIATVCKWRNANTAGRGMAVGLLLWIGVVGPITFTTHLYEMRPLELFEINEFYPLAGLCLMGAILGAWTKKSA
jgi:Protein of unknown function (DUF1761)